MSAENFLHDDEIDKFVLAAGELSGLKFPSAFDLTPARNTLKKCIEGLGKNFVDDIRAYALENQRDTVFAQLFFENVLSGIINKETFQIDEKILANKLKNYQKMLAKATQEAKKLYGNKNNLDYVAFYNLGIPVPKNYKLTESDMGFALKHISGGKHFPLKKGNNHITEVAELSENPHAAAPTLEKVLKDFDSKNKAPYTVFVPLNLGNYHWIYLRVTKDASDNIQVQGSDSLHRPNYTDLEIKLLVELNKVYPQLTRPGVEVKSSKKQTNNSGCGSQTVRGIAEKIDPDNILCQKNNEDELQQAVIAIIKKQAEKEGKIKKSSSHDPSLFGKKKSSPKNEITIDDDMKETIESKLLGKRFKLEGDLDKWPLKVTYIPDDKTTNEVEMTINEVKNKNSSYISITAETDDVKFWKKLIDKTFEMGKTSVGIYFKDKQLTEDLLEYCKERNYAVENAPNKLENRK
jgi:hypothetical protein